MFRPVPGPPSLLGKWTNSCMFSRVLVVLGLYTLRLPHIDLCFSKLLLTTVLVIKLERLSRLSWKFNF
jgi:hypothetical protein